MSFAKGIALRIAFLTNVRNLAERPRKAMKNIKETLGRWVRLLAGSLREYPLEILLCLTYFVLYLLHKQLDPALKVHTEQVLAWFFPHFAFCFSLHQLKDRHPIWKALYYLCWFAWIPLLLWCSDPNSWSVSIAYLLAGIALIIGRERMDNVSFGRHALSVAVRLGEGLMVGIVLWLIIYAVGSTVNILFDLEWRSTWFDIPSVFCWIVITPLVCCGLLATKAEFSKGDNLLRIIVDIILTPALILYAAILYLYLLRILFRWELPNGGVAIMVLVFLCVALVCHLLRLQVEKRHFEWFYKALPVIALPPLVLLWVGIFRRIGDYGITDSRVYLLGLSALVTVFLAMLLKERTRRFQLMALMLAAGAILLTYIPGIRARDFGLRSQQARLDRLLPEVLEDGKFPKIDDYEALVKDPVRCKQVEDSYGAWTYLMGEMDPDAFKERYGQYGDYTLSQWTLRQAKAGHVSAKAIAELTGDGPKVWSLKEMDKDIDLGPYTQLVHRSFTREDSLGIAFCTQPDFKDTLLYCPVRERLDAADENTSPEDILVYENGEYKAVIWIVRDYAGLSAHHNTNAVSVLFKKP